jgi:hypothetical protein
MKKNQMKQYDLNAKWTINPIYSPSQPLKIAIFGTIATRDD